MGRKKKQVQAGKIRRVFHSFRYTECDAFAEYLHEMSLDGWHFKKWQMGLLFEKGEPVDITYCVDGPEARETGGGIRRLLWSRWMGTDRWTAQVLYLPPHGFGCAANRHRRRTICQCTES